MKVLHIIPNMEPSHDGVVVGGSVNSMLRIIKEVQGEVDSTVFTNSNQKRAGNFDLIRDVNIVKYYNPFKRGTFLYGVFFTLSCIYYLLKNPAQRCCINGHSGYAVYILTTLLIGFVYGVNTIHNLYCPVSTNRKGILSYLNYFSIRYFSHCVDSLISMSKNIKKSVVSNSKYEVSVVGLPPMIDLSEYTPNNSDNEIPVSLNGHKSAPIVLFVGNRKREKGLDILIEALGDISNKFRFVYTTELDEGKDSIIDDFDLKLNEHGINKVTTHLSLIDFMPTLIAKSDVLVVPFRSTDGPSDYPLVILEAMASGTPVVASRVGGIPELIENGTNGLLVEPSDPDQLRSSISRLLDDASLRSSLADGMRNKVRALRSRGSVSPIIVNTYESVCK